MGEFFQQNYIVYLFCQESVCMLHCQEGEEIL